MQTAGWPQQVTAHAEPSGHCWLLVHVVSSLQLSPICAQKVPPSTVVVQKQLGLFMHLGKP